MISATEVELRVGDGLLYRFPKPVTMSYGPRNHHLWEYEYVGEDPEVPGNILYRSHVDFVAPGEERKIRSAPRERFDIIPPTHHLEVEITEEVIRAYPQFDRFLGRKLKVDLYMGYAA